MARNMGPSFSKGNKMPDAASRVTIAYESSGGTVPTGWTETFYSETADLDILISDARTLYLPSRVSLLGKGAVAKFIRASHIPPDRKTKVVQLGGKQGENQSLTDSARDAYDPTQVDLLYRLRDADGHARQFWLAGLPDRYTDQLVAQGVDAGFLNGPAFKQFSDAILNARFLIRWKNSSGVPTPYLATRIVSCDPVMIRNRKRGRPFRLFRGRRAV